MADSNAETLVKPTSKEVSDSWAKNLSGKLVTFGEGTNLAWGVEASLPINENSRTFLSNYGINLPLHVNAVRFLTLSPQESLPPDGRTIRSKKTIESTLQLLTDTTTDFKTFTKPGERPYEYLAREFIKVLPSDEDKERFNKLVQASQAGELVIVQGHGGSDPRSIGEQYNDSPRDQSGKSLQRSGNTVLVDEILEKYDNKSQYSAILLDSCYSGTQELIAKSVPVFHIEGLSSLVNSSGNKNKPRLSLPTNS